MFLSRRRFPRAAASAADSLPRQIPSFTGVVHAEVDDLANIEESAVIHIDPLQYRLT